MRETEQGAPHSRVAKTNREETDRENTDILLKTSIMATAFLPSALKETGREVCTLLHSATHSRLGRSSSATLM